MVHDYSTSLRSEESSSCRSRIEYQCTVTTDSKVSVTGSSERASTEPTPMYLPRPTYFQHPAYSFLQELHSSKSAGVVARPVVNEDHQIFCYHSRLPRQVLD